MLRALVLEEPTGDITRSRSRGTPCLSGKAFAYGLAVMLLACGMAWGMALLHGMK
jgi:hypothetical protein